MARVDGARRRGEAAILHADLDAFYASVEQRDNPRLAGRAVIVGGGVVLAASYEARRFGVRTAMGGSQARRLCPHAVVVEPRMAAYSEASKAVFAVFEDTTPLVEGLSIDEAFLDVSGLRRLVGPAPTIAERLRRRVRDEIGLPLSVGVATTKFLAKVASQVAKPDGLLVVEAGGELAFLHPLPVGRLWGVGPVTQARLRAKGINTVAEVAALGEGPLVSLLGPALGRHLHALAHNRDPRGVRPRRRRKSVGSQRSFGLARLPLDEADGVLLEVVDGVAKRLRDGKRVARTAVVRFRFGDYRTATRSHTLAEATDSTSLLLRAARELLADAWPLVTERGLTRLGFAVTGLQPADAVQLTLPFERRDRGTLDHAVDAVRDRFGRHSIRPTSLLGRSGIEVPLLADPADADADLG